MSKSLDVSVAVDYEHPDYSVCRNIDITLYSGSLYHNGLYSALQSSFLGRMRHIQGTAFLLASKLPLAHVKTNSLPTAVPILPKTDSLPTVEAGLPEAQAAHQNLA